MYREQPLVGEFGICASQIIALEYIIEHNIPELLVFEDDVILSAKFPQLFANAYDELPPGYDFLADCSVFPNERFTNNIECNILYKDFISKTHLQNAHLGMMLYSLDGAKKLLALLKEHGFFAPIDTMVFHFARNEMLDGYTTYFANKLIEQKDIFGSTIDVHNIRR
jgi:GR25 family glycosyltransferase involved in LPS biosynthesis